MTGPDDRPSVANPPGQTRLRRRIATHATALERMRAALGATEGTSGTRLTLRALARTDDPAVAVLDSWAYVADVVAFYNERIAHEGYLRTATQRGSVRELARMLGYELRPGVAAQVDMAFFAQAPSPGAPGASDPVTVPRGTPAQSVPKAAPLTGPPGPKELPQTFETTDDLEVRPEWNVLPVIASVPQVLAHGRDHVWLGGASTTLREGDTVLVVGRERRDHGTSVVRPRPADTLDGIEKWDFRVVVAVEPGADGHAGWVRLRLDRPIGSRRSTTMVAEQDVTVHAFTTRARLFGWNAPDPNLLVTEGHVPAGATLEGTTYVWADFAVTTRAEPDVIEVDGEHPEVLVDSWVVLEQPGTTEVYRVERITPDGAQKFALTGPVSRLRLDLTENLTSFERPRATVHCGTRQLPAADEPATAPVTGGELTVLASDPPLPPGRRIVVRGLDATTRRPLVESAAVRTCTPMADGSMSLVLETGLTGSFAPDGLEVLANVAVATHGESVAEVLGSGDGRAEFATLRPRRAPITHVRATTPEGARVELTVRVDGVAWAQVPSLEQATATERVYALTYDEDGGSRIVVGDGVHGARPPTGAENVRAEYRVGIGAAGAVDAGQISLLPRRPLGVREVTNPVPAADWAPAETLEAARANAPLRVRTLDRAVSVADHEDFARGYAGIGPARADLVWDGRLNRVLLSILGAAASAVSDDLIDDLEASLDAARDPSGPLAVLPGTITWFGVRVEVAHDPVYERPAVLDAVRAALDAAFGPAVSSFGVPVTEADALVVIRTVPGVAACTMPRLLPVAALPEPPLPPVLPPDGAAQDVIRALPGRWDPDVPSPGLVPATLAALAPGGVEIGVMQL